MKLKYCKDCRLAVYETKGEKLFLWCKVRKEYIGFYFKTCKEFK